MHCINSFLGICFAPVTTTASLFGFKDFIAALALLVIIYTISDIRYRFRISVSPTPLFKISYVLIILIGFGTLATDIWISEKLPVPEIIIITAAIWQGILAALFLGLVITWMHYAFIKPPIYGRNNYQKYAQELYRIVLKGSDAELPVIAHELAASAESLVTLAAGLKRAEENLKPCAESYANDMLLLIANRRFCRHLVASSPLTAIRFLDAATEFKAFHIPIGLFAQNVSTEAIQNKDSSLYHEVEGYYSGLLGYIKPFSQALYGNYELVEALDNHSPLDIHFKSVWAWDADQFETYCRVTQMTLKSYLEGGHWGRHSSVLTRALGDIQETTCRAISDIEIAGDDYHGDEWNRLSAGIDFIKDSINAIEELKPSPNARTLRIRHRLHDRIVNEDFYDRLAEAMFKIIHSAAHIEGPPGKAWTVHHNSVWGEFFGPIYDGRAWKVVQFKLRRLLYDEILKLGSMPNYKSARVLGICLNVMGLSMGKRSGYNREHAALKAAVLTWTQRNYLRLREVNAEIAGNCLIGSITFDTEQSRLVKTYAKGLKPEPAREYLPLQLPSAARA
ncbi:MAG: hypothetical protein A2063_01785 [Gallionellales bacterium GWA2_60_142]|nr:MAG: hypothetical protein A2063_01785 [Gallionellales bacterium GWA2_60_142]HCI12386.1 hypothetical protein [Gallionellaceae bacterium]